MKKRPRSLKFLGAFLIIVSISIPIQIALRFEHHFLDFYTIWIKISVLSRVIMLMCLVNAWLAFSAQAALLITSPLLTALVIWNNFLLSYFDPSIPVAQTGLASFAFLLVSALVFEPKARLVLTQPERRWWRIGRRQAVLLPARLHAGDLSIEAQTFDLSSSGVFLTQAPALSGGLSLQPNFFSREDPVEILLDLPGGRQITLQGEVARQTDRQDGIYPSGIGIRLCHRNWIGKLKMRFLIRSF